MQNKDYAALILAVLNGIVAVLNALVFAHSGSTVDFVATVAWVGSTVFWVFRSSYDG